MRNNPLSFYFLIIVSLLLSACAGAAPAVSVDEVQTVAAVTFQALTVQAVAENTIQAMTVPASEPFVQGETGTALPPPLTPTPTPVIVQPRGSFIPIPDEGCERLRALIEDALGKPVLIETVPFSDWVTGGAGEACRIHATGSGATYNMAGGPFGALKSLLESNGWSEDQQYGAAGPTGMGSGFRQGGTIGILTSRWHASEDADCPDDQPITMCNLMPEQKIFDVIFDAADLVVYNPPTDDECRAALAVLQPAFPIPLEMEIVEFTDFELNRGTGCQVRADGNGITFSGVGETAQTIDAILAPLGWTLINGADGPRGTGREYTLGKQVAVVLVKWTPSPEADCPKDAPYGACQLTPGQMLYTVTVTFGEK